RRVILPGRATNPLSLVMDWSGIYYDAREPSDLEGMLASGEFTPQEIDTGNELMAALRRHRLSKYNDARLSSRMPLFTGKASTRVLVIDQTYGDASIQGGLAN